MDKYFKNIKEFKSFCDNHYIDFLVVGSLALNVLGFTDDIPHDIDLEVIRTVNSELVFKSMAESSNLKNNYEGNTPLVFNFKGIIYNVWLVTTFTHPKIMHLDYIKYAGVNSILAAKLKYGRPKDHNLIDGFISNLLKLKLESYAKNSKS